MLFDRLTQLKQRHIQGDNYEPLAIFGFVRWHSGCRFTGRFARDGPTRTRQPDGRGRKRHRRQSRFDLLQPALHQDAKTGEARKIWGGLVPFGQVWRLGANEATLIVTQQPLDFGGVTIPAGASTLFFLPMEDGTG